MMRFLALLAVGTGLVLALAGVGWGVARVNGSMDLTIFFGRILLWDIYLILGLGAYVAFVGLWHIWERVTGKMELQAEREARERAEATAREGEG